MDSNELSEKDNAHIKGRSVYDRRSGEDRRDAHNLDYFLNGGVERRKMAERRRQRRDRRKKWVMGDSSVSVPKDI